MSLPYPACDLREHAPRAATVQLGGLLFLARTIDKMRAKLQNTIGEYRIGPGISFYLFEWLGITEAQFEEAVRAAKNDDDIVAWLHANTDAATYPDINERLRTRGIRDAAHRAEVLPRYPVLHEHPELTNWFEIFAVDDVWIFDPKNRTKATASS